MEDKFQDDNPYMAGRGTPASAYRVSKLTTYETYLQAQGHPFAHIL